MIKRAVTHPYEPSQHEVPGLIVYVKWDQGLSLGQFRFY